MNKKEFIREIHKRGNGRRIKEAEKFVDDFLNIVEESLVNGTEIRFHGFGTFLTRKKSPKTIVNVHTREEIAIPGYDAPAFRPGEALKRSVRDGIIRG